MKKDSNGESVQPLQRQTSKSREWSSVSSPNRFLSPTHRKSPDTRKNKNSEELVLIRGPWPSAMSSSSSSSSLSQSSNFTSSLSTNSSSSSSLSSFSSILSARRESGTLADHLGNERLMDLIDKRERRHSKITQADNLTRQKSCSETRVLSKASFSLKENRPMGGSMRYTDPNSNSSQFPIPGRLSIDARTLNFSSRNWSHDEDRSVGPDSDGSGSIDLSSKSSTSAPASRLARKKPGNKIPGRFWQEISPGSGKKEGGSQWALSPGRGGHMGLRPPSPPSPVKTKGVSGFLNMGLELLKGRRSNLGNGNGKGGGVVLIMDEAGQELRVLNNRLLQWRFLNAKAQFLVEKKATFAQINFINAWGSISKLQESVSHKRFQLQKDKLDHKLNYVLGSQAKAFKAWDGIQREHTVAVSKTKDCLNAVVSRVPLVDGAKGKSQTVSQALRQAADIANSIKTTIYLLTTMRMASLLPELARVVTKEMALLEETFELLGVVADLELEERSLRCHIIQLRTQQHKDELPSRVVHP
ncbi:hypothetical protein AMTRI_Chr02g261540 [Amborella trichopoda]